MIGLIAGVALARRSAAGFRGAVFVASAMFICLTLTALTVHHARSREIQRFAPDTIRTEPFWRSLRYAPEEYQFFLHARAWKACKPYAWSYREMRFYEVPEAAAPNVMNAAPTIC